MSKKGLRQLASVSPRRITATGLAGEKIDGVLSTAPGNGGAIGGIKVIAASGWFAARPSGTDDIYKKAPRPLSHIHRPARSPGV